MSEIFSPKGLIPRILARIPSAKTIRALLDEKLFKNNNEFNNIIERLTEQITNAAISKSDQVIFKKHKNEQYNKKIYEMLINKGYTVENDYIIQYVTNSENETDQVDVPVFVIKF